MHDDDRRAANRRMVEAFMVGISDADFAALESICTADFVAELPYSDPPKRYEGFAAYRAAVEPMLETLRFRLRLETIHPGLDPDLLVAEYTSEGIAKPTGKPYRNVYIGLYRFRDGRLCGLREFYNPMPALESLSVD